MGKSEAAPQPSTAPVALPKAGISEILGLIELIKSHGGREEIYQLANELKMELGETLAVIRGAELLGLLHTPGGDVVLEKLGEKISAATINQKKALIKKQIERLPVFRKISELLREKDNGEMSRDEVLEALAELLPNDDVEDSFSVLVSWGRYAELFGYNDDLHAFYLDNGQNHS